MGTKIYLGMPPASVVEWIRAERDRKGPLFFQANEPGASVAMLCWDNYNGKQTDLKCHLQYSTNKMATWAAYNGSIVELDDCTDNRVYFRADPENPNTDGFYTNNYTHYFKTDKSVKAGGNIQFLLESTGTRMDVPAHGFQYLFGKEDYDAESSESSGSCSSLITAPELPATMLADYCYYGMFHNCTSLTTAPVLPATILANYCYSFMFSHCSSMVTAPKLPATTLTDRCYCSMFVGCSSLTTAPTLPATTLASSCYRGMFQNCRKLTSINISFTAWNPSDATVNWVSGTGTEATGKKTFTCPAALPKTTGYSNIPSGWTIIEK